MKTKRPPPRDAPVVEQLVEDLSQQDVLPVETETDSTQEQGMVGQAEEQAGRWDEPVGTLGHQVARVPLEDESNAAVDLVERGVNEAEEELQEMSGEQSPTEDEEA